MPLIETSGNVTADAYAGGVAVKPKYIEDFFQTWLRTGTGASATVTTGLDASTNKALVWTKSRSAATDHKLTDTVRGATKALISDTTGAQTTDTNGLTAFSATGYTIGSDTNYNNSGATYVDWEFVATPKFFDVVTYTGNGTAGNAISHNLGSAPGCMIVKRTDTGGADWYVYHRSLGNSSRIELNLTDAAFSGATVWNSQDPTSTQFFLGSGTGVNGSGGTYVAYLFAHNAGGFGLTGTDNVISCGSYTPSAGAPSTFVNLGYEPQFVLIKNTNISGSAYTGWGMFDNMRGVTTPGDDQFLLANSSAEESNGAALGISSYVDFNATGFTANATTLTGANGGGHTYIYIAIRRGPMKVPTDATKVFSPLAITNSGTTTNTVGFPVDLQIDKWRTTSDQWYWVDRLRGLSSVPSGTSTTTGPVLNSAATSAEVSTNNIGYLYDNTSFQTGYGFGGLSMEYYNFQRSPSFFDVVCYTGNGTYAARNHNLTVAPELSITKQRDGSFFYWTVIYATSSTLGNYLSLNRTDAAGFFGSTGFTATQFGLADDTNTKTYVTYLFATCPGVSKVGSYTGTGATQTISCGFTGGARFVLIKRTDSTGDWYVWDTARGMTAGTDPSLLLNSTAAEVNANSIYTTTGGFQIVSTAAGINASGGTYIFLAIS